MRTASILCAAAMAVCLALPAPALAGETSVEKPNPWVYALPVIAVVGGLIWGISAGSSDSPKKTAATKPKGVEVAGGPWVAPGGGGVVLQVAW